MAIKRFLSSSNYLQGADVSRKRQDGATPLHLAAERGHSEVIRALVVADADVNAVKSDGSTALYLASLHGQHEVVAELLKLKDILDINAGTSEQWTALHAACARFVHLAPSFHLPCSREPASFLT